MVDYSFLKFSGSMMAAAATYATAKALGRPDAFPRAMQKHSGFTEAQVRRRAACLRSCKRSCASCLRACLHVRRCCSVCAPRCAVCTAPLCRGGCQHHEPRQHAQEPEHTQTNLQNAPRTTKPNPRQVRPAAVALATLFRRAPNASLTAVYKKHCSHKFQEVAKQPAPLALLAEAPIEG